MSIDTWRAVAQDIARGLPPGDLPDGHALARMLASGAGDRVRLLRAIRVDADDVPALVEQVAARLHAVRETLTRQEDRLSAR